MAVVYGALAGVLLVVGALLIYAFGAGYFNYVAVPTPLNFVIAPAMLFGLIVLLGRFVLRRV